MARPPSWIKGVLLLREGGYRKGGEGEREGRQQEGKKEKRVREGRKGTPCVSLNFPQNNL